MEHSVWVDTLLDRVCEVGDEGLAAMQYIRTHKTKIGFKRVRSNVGAFWTIFGNIRLNSLYYTYDTPMDDLRIRTLIIHEARHLQQGIATALSVYGELDAWQLEFRIYHRIKGNYPHPSIAELMTLPLEYDRAALFIFRCVPILLLDNSSLQSWIFHDILHFQNMTSPLRIG